LLGSTEHAADFVVGVTVGFTDGEGLTDGFGVTGVAVAEPLGAADGSTADAPSAGVNALGVDDDEQAASNATAVVSATAATRFRGWRRTAAFCRGERSGTTGRRR
jgi:hypothetical protein